MNYKFLNYIKNDKTYLEKEPLEKITKKKQLSAFKHMVFGSAWILYAIKKILKKFLKKKFKMKKNILIVGGTGFIGFTYPSY